MTEQRVPNKNRFKELCESGEKGLFNHACIRSRELAKKDISSWKKPKEKYYSIPNPYNLTEKEKAKPESKVLEETKDFLKQHNIWFMRMNTEGLQRDFGMQTNPNAGFSDFMIFYNGFVIFAEAKRPYNAKYSERQGDFLANAYKARQVSGLYSSIEGLKDLLRQAHTGVLKRPDVIHAKNLPEFIDTRGAA